jgi:hypothetical protein
VTDRDGPAVDVEDVVVDSELVAAVDRLDGERFVQLPDTDVVDAETSKNFPVLPYKVIERNAPPVNEIWRFI